MAAVMVELMPRPARTGIAVDRIEIVDDLDALTESNKCACAASDDNPY
jgi:hypothetical protein